MRIELNSNMLSIVEVINRNTFRWFGHIMRRVGVNAEGCDDVKFEGKETPRNAKTNVATQHR